MNRSIWGNERGFSLVSVMVAGAIGMVILYALLDGVFVMSRGQKSVAVSAEWNEFFTAVDRVLKYDNTCGAVLAGMEFPTSSTTQKIDIELKMPYGGNPGPIRAGFKVVGDIIVESVTLQNSPLTVTPRPVRIPDATNTLIEYNRYLARIEVTAVKIQKNLPGGERMKTRETLIPVLVDSSGKIQLCHAENSVVESCIAGGGTWMESNPPEQRCVPQSFCKHGGSYSFGHFVNPLTGHYNCPPVENGNPYKKMISGVITTVTTCGKNCIGQDDDNVYQCLKCD